MKFLSNVKDYSTSLDRPTATDEYAEYNEHKLIAFYKGMALETKVEP